MARYTFSVSPDYQDDDVEIYDVRDVQPSLDYCIELPKNTDVTVQDLQYHFTLWLRGKGYYVDVPDMDVIDEDDVDWSDSAMYTPPELDTATPGSW